MKFGQNKKARRTTAICVFLAFLLVGLFVARYTTPLSICWLVLVVILCPISFGKRYILLLYLCLAGLIFGWWRGGVWQSGNLQLEQYYDQKVTLVGRATEDSYYGNKSQIQFTVENIAINGQRLQGKVQIKGFGEPMVYRHDLVEVTGKLYKTRGGKQAGISFSDIDVLARSTSTIENLRREFIAGMQNALPEPAASFATGLLIGQRSLLPDKTSEVLLIAGLTHIVAVSGYNLTIIVKAVRQLLKRFSRFQILALSSTLIYIFLLITGYSPSIVRASLVSMLSLVAWYFGRQFRPILLILLAAAVTGFVNPYYVWADIGWYLSFLAFFGVLVVAPLLQARIFGNKKVPLLGSVAIESFAAQIMTLPLIMMIFGRISLVGLLANVIIVPLVPLAMLFGLFAGLAGMTVPAIAGWFALPARLLLNVMLWLTAWFARWPHAQIQRMISPGNLVALYSILLVIIIGLKKRAQSVKIKTVKSIME
jgi:ComEC/Rec2-related protein